MTLQASSNWDSAQDALVAHVTNSVQNCRLIMDYLRRPFAVDMYEKYIVLFNKADVAQNKIMVTNKFFAPWISNVVVGAFIVYGGLQVIDSGGGISVGLLLTNIDVYKEVGQAWGAIYGVTLIMQTAIPALESITRFMNLPTDVEKRRLVNR